jgi:FKBP-type peptidyl-prolyl cis-trans isomerase
MSQAVDAQPVTTTPSGLKIIDIKVGAGPSPKPGQTCVMNYTGWLDDNGNLPNLAMAHAAPVASFHRMPR